MFCVDEALLNQFITTSDDTITALAITLTSSESYTVSDLFVVGCAGKTILRQKKCIPIITYVFEKNNSQMFLLDALPTTTTATTTTTLPVCGEFPLKL